MSAGIRAGGRPRSTPREGVASVVAMAPAPRDGYGDALRREILRSEQQRMRALAVILFLLLLATSFAANFLPELTHRMFRGGIEGWFPLAAIGPFVAYEAGALYVLGRRIARDRDFPR